MRVLRNLCFIVIVTLFACNGFLVAQKASLPGSSGVYPLELKSDPQLKYGKFAAVQGTADAKGQELEVGDLSVLQPVQVTLLATNKNDDLRLALSKLELGSDVAESGSTKGTGFVTYKFRTEGDLQIKVRSPGGPRPYELFVWAGNKVNPPVPSAFVPMSTYLKQHPGSGGKDGFGGLVLWVIAGTLIIICGFLAVLVLKRRQA